MTKIPAAELRYRCAPIEPTEGPVSRIVDLLGQPRALAALRVGLDLNAVGFHVFVSGLVGMGRTTVVRQLIEELVDRRDPALDRLLVYSHAEPDRPRLLEVATGRAPVFQREFGVLLERVHEAIQAALEARPHHRNRQIALDRAERRERQLFDALGRVAETVGCMLQVGDDHGVDVVVGVGEDWLGVDEVHARFAEGGLNETERDDLLARRSGPMERLEAVMVRMRRFALRTKDRLRRLDTERVREVAGSVCAEFAGRWSDEGVGRLLDDLLQVVVERVELWSERSRSEPPPEGEPPPPHPVDVLADCLPVHVVSTRAADARSPIVVETQPGSTNLIGCIEVPRESTVAFGRVQAGALLRAHGGFLVLRARDVCRDPVVWQTLAQCLAVGEVELRDYDPASGASPGFIQPTAIPIAVKVVLIGELGSYEDLAHAHLQFLRTFKIHAEFESSVPNDADHRQRYADYVRFLVQQHELPAFEGAAIASVIEFGVRCSGRRDRLSTHFGEIADVVREAAWRARDKTRVEKDDVAAALAARTERVGLVRDHAERDFARGYVDIDTTGREIGRCVAMTVIDTGTFEFGKPAVVSASTGVGTRPQVVDIERESELSGPLHDKGVLALTGYLIDRFGRDGPLCLHATVCVEQVYGGIDGDSASAAELCALLSSLGRVPIRQDLALTGSVNQRGGIQAVGGVNEKIESWYRLCRVRGLTGEQGVIVPAANLGDLQLDDDVCRAVEDGTFAVHAIDDVRAALELLVAGDPDDVLGPAGDALAKFRTAVGPSDQ